ncbi:hypothetical protein [Actinoplanes sp. NPDC049802]|uniref:hypothetical protein n=1 Tax=Actinoplanes sp. NPDC049802 TaxID=3154742 RepID=UPI0033C4ADCC
MIKRWFTAALAGVLATLLVPAAAWASTGTGELMIEAARRSRRGGFGFFGILCCLAVVGVIVVVVFLISRNRKRR